MTEKPAAKCPICAKPARPKYRPFCSDRCSDLDLGRWLKGSYVLPDETPVSLEIEDEDRE